MRVALCRRCGIRAVTFGTDEACIACAQVGGLVGTPAVLVRHLRAAYVRGVRGSGGDTLARQVGLSPRAVHRILRGQSRQRVV